MLFDGQVRDVAFLKENKRESSCQAESRGQGPISHDTIDMRALISHKAAAGNDHLVDCFPR